MKLCGQCGQPAKGFAAIGGTAYCHVGASPTCYETAVLLRGMNGAGFSFAVTPGPGMKMYWPENKEANQ